MAGKGGGAWKVAYADFVTAMMAFFLVMWICSQDQKVKQAVARYFVTPIGIVETGASKKPNRTGAIFPAPTSGSVPSSEAVALGRGRVSHTPPTDVSSNATKVVSDWLRTTELDSYWQSEAQIVRDYARMSKELLDKPGSADDAAMRQLSTKLREQVSRRVQSEHGELSQELLAQILAEVNWTELAEDLLANHGADDAVKGDSPPLSRLRAQAPVSGPNPLK
jgi:flagellar motor protein MotB